MNKKALAIIAVWVGLCFIPTMGPTLSSMWFMFWLFFSITNEEE